MSRAILVSLLLGVVAACGGGGGGGGGSNASPPTTTTPPAEPTAAELRAAARLLSLASFGPSYDDIDALARQGEQAWLNSQFNLPASTHMAVVTRYANEYGADVSMDPPPGLYRRYAFWERALLAPDQLRQLTAYALSQIFVVSDNVDALAIDPRALASFYDLLLTHAFGNYRDLLLDVSLHPVMGVYLSHVNNARSEPAANTFPDENYAREVMQLFSIGLFELNPDGSQVLDGAGQPVPTYDNSDIREFAKIFTGLSYGPEAPGSASFFGKQAPVLHVPMVMFDAYHEPGQKRLLNGVVVPAGQAAMTDVEDAVDNLFNHPNVGPFIGRLLIQRLVTSNPSPAYVQRVAEAFAGSGGSPRGDMQATLRAILLDPEAASAVRLQEPLRRYIAMNRALGSRADDGTVPGVGFVVQFLTQQHVMSAPSVFNFYSPDFAPAGPIADAGLVSPEFQITNDSTVVGMTNLVAYALYSEQSIDTAQGFARIQPDLLPWENLAGDAAALVDRLDLVFYQGRMDADTRGAIVDAVNSITNDNSQRARVGLYLALIAPAVAVYGETP